MAKKQDDKNEKAPERAIQQPAENVSYYDQRMKLLGVNEKNNTMDALYFDTGEGKNVMKPFQIFRKSELGIEIHVTTLARLPIIYAKEGSRHKNQKFHITRLEKPVEKKGQQMKYNIPPGAGTYPFFPPSVIEAFESKEEVHTLILTEGYFKAFKGAMHGLVIIGLSSITHLREKDSQSLYPDIKKFIVQKKVKRVIFLHDGDCMNITSKEIVDGIDLYKRPNGFFQSAAAFKRLLDDFKEVEKIYAHVLSDKFEGSPKGLDDLMIAFPKEANEIAQDLQTVSERESKYFFRENITFSLHRLHHYLRLNSVKEFYLFHIEKREELKGKEFIFNGTRYRWNEQKMEIEVVIPGAAQDYFRVGDQYFEYVEIPNKYNVKERTFHKRMKGTIIEDYGKNFCQHIPKYKAFCNVPDHQNWQKIIHNNFNMYAPFEHEAEPGDCETIMKLLRHIFGNGVVSYIHPKTKERGEISELDLGLDYLQLLYQQPTQILPILCLVSRENATGKSTLAKLLKMIFTQNVAIVGNAELSDNFNASWASKLLVICDEAKIDKQVVVEKVKSLSTAEKIMMNSKGKDHVEIDFFAKFMFLTNFEENFIYASDDDVRYWVRKVPVITETNVEMLSDMKEEIPAFLHLLNSRAIKTENLHRAWFHPSLIKTDALKKVIEHSRSAIEKEIRSKLREMFLDFNEPEILMTKKVIHEKFFRGRFEDHYLERVLKENIRADYYFIVEGEQKKYVVRRYSYPQWERKEAMGGATELVRVDIKDVGRPFVFKREMFVSEVEQLSMSYELGLDESQLALGAPADNLGAHNSDDDPPF